MLYQNLAGVPDFELTEFAPRTGRWCLIIPVINEGQRILTQLQRAYDAGVHTLCDILLCDGGSTDGSMEPERLKALGVNALLVKKGPGKQGAQLRCGLWLARQRGYDGVLTIDGNNKDSIEDSHRFIEKLEQGVDFIQGSRFIPGGQAINTPLIRYLSVRLLHAPVISLTAKHKFTDTTNNHRAYSARYLWHPGVQPLRDIFTGYELLAYLSVRASQLGLTCCEVPVTRAYPKGEKTPTKISFFKGNSQLLKILYANWKGEYAPDEVR